MVASIVGLIFSIAMCAISSFFFYIPSFINSCFLRLGTLAVGFNIIMAEIFFLAILWIFFLITSALVTVCSRPYSLGAVLTPCYRNNSLISNGAGVITKSAAFLRLSKHSVGFAGAFYPFSLSLRLSSLCWATLAEHIGVPPRIPKLPKHAKLTPRPYQPT